MAGLLAKPRDIRQRTTYDCGPSVIESIAGVRPRIGNRLGTGYKAIHRALVNLGYSTISGTWRLEDLEYLVLSGRYVICAVTTDDGWQHWCTVYRAGKYTISYHCPIKGYVTESLDKFDNRWICGDVERLGVAVAI